MYTQNDFPVGSKARVIATGDIMEVSELKSDGAILRNEGMIINSGLCKAQYGIFFRLYELEPVFEYGDDVEASNDGKKWFSNEEYGCGIKRKYNREARHITFDENGLVAAWTFCRRANSRKSELLKQLEQAREEERKAVEKREELEKELETIN